MVDRGRPELHRSADSRFCDEEEGGHTFIEFPGFLVSLREIALPWRRELDLIGLAKLVFQVVVAGVIDSSHFHPQRLEAQCQPG